jgi:hypothetical protein
MGFTFESIFRQHMVVKGENRNTAWFSMLDQEWPARKRAFEACLAPQILMKKAASGKVWQRLPTQIHKQNNPSHQRYGPVQEARGRSFERVR